MNRDLTVAVDRLTHMIPADGWYVAYCNSEPPYYFLERLVCWGLCGDATDGADKYILGFAPDEWTSGYLTDVNDSAQFLGFIHKDDLSDDRKADFEERGKELSEHLAAKRKE